jgi:hypothetical protein
MGAYKCPTCRGTDIGDNAGGLKCLGCGAALKFIGGPAVVLLDAPDVPETSPEVAPEVSAEPVGEFSGE